MTDPRMTEPCVISGHARLIWCLIAFLAALTLMSFLLTGLAVDPWSNLPLLALIGVLFVVSGFYRLVRRDVRLQTITEASGQILLILLFGILLTYAAMAVAFPYRDAELHLIDKALRLDRSAYLAFFNSRPWFAEMAGLAYLSLLPQFALVPLALFITDRLLRLQVLMLGVGIALLLTNAISVFTPAVDAFVYLDITPPVFAKISTSLHTQVPTLEALRSGALRSIRLDNLEGLITFPSFHTAGGLLFAWALREVPYLRWLGLTLNGALIAATPVHGAHYFIDLIGGAAVAFLSIMASHWLSRRAQPAAMSAAAAAALS